MTEVSATLTCPPTSPPARQLLSPAPAPALARPPCARCAPKAGRSSPSPAARNGWTRWRPRPAPSPSAADVTDDADVARLLGEVTRAGGIDTLINIAGGARGADKVGGAKTEDWEWMFQVNVLGTMKLTRAFLPMLRGLRRGHRPEPDVHGRAGRLRRRRRLQRRQVRPACPDRRPAAGGGRAQPPRHRGGPRPGPDRGIRAQPARRPGRAAKVYAGRGEAADGRRRGRCGPLRRAAPHHVNLDQIVIRPVAQASNYKLIRKQA